MSASTPLSEPICNEVSDRLPQPRRRPCWVPLHYGLIGLLHAGAVFLVIWLANHPGAVLNTGLARGAVAPVRATLLSAEWLAAQRHARHAPVPRINAAGDSDFAAEKPHRRDASTETVPLSTHPRRRNAPPKPIVPPKISAPKLAVHQTHPPQTQRLAQAKPRSVPPNNPPMMNDTPPERASAPESAATLHTTASSPVSPSRAARPDKGGVAAPIPVAAQAEATTPVGGPIITQPHYRQPPQPEAYPPLARRRGWQGTVLIEVWLDGEGEQIKRQILQGSGHAVLDQAALRSVARNQFAPYTRNGIGQPARLHLPVIFSLSAP